MNRLIAVIVLLLLSGRLLAAEDSDSYTATMNAQGEQEIFMEAESYSYTPDRIVVRVGVPVVLNVKKKGIIPHDIIIDDPASGLDIKENLGSSTVIRFTPREKGEFPLYCGKSLLFFKSHSEKGMHGVLVVK